MQNTNPALIGAIRELSSVASTGPATIEDLTALSAAHDHVEQLLRSCVDELRDDPRAAALWSAMSYAVTGQSATVTAASPRRASASSASASRAGTVPKRGYRPATNPGDVRVRQFWDTFADAFAWDLLPGDFLHELYATWMDAEHPWEQPLTKNAFTRRLNVVAQASGEWEYLRSRPGALMARHEPLARHLPRWRPGCPSVAVYGLRRCCTMVR